MKRSQSRLQQLNMMDLMNCDMNDSFVKEALRASVEDLLALSVSLDEYSVSSDPNETTIESSFDSDSNYHSGSDATSDIISVPRHSTPRLVVRSESMCYREVQPCSDDEDDWPLTLWRPDSNPGQPDDTTEDFSHVYINFSSPIPHITEISNLPTPKRRKSLGANLKRLRHRLQKFFKK